MAGRHGVPAPERKTHAREAAGVRRSRAQRRDAAQSWTLWLMVRGLLALVVLAAAAWSVHLLTTRRGGFWPVIALVAGALSLLMIGLDVRARRRQRARARARTVDRLADTMSGTGAGPALAAAPFTGLPATPAEAPAPAAPAPGEPPPATNPAGFVPQPPPLPGRHSHRR